MIQQTEKREQGAWVMGTMLGSYDRKGVLVGDLGRLGVLQKSIDQKGVAT